ncbi:MAG TPA: SPOR domain-containing protein, partial [Herminiimonas sp.]|nr:SPOR domain-containing protein [Herminiimonas sp.]
MGLFSFFRKNKQESSVGNSDFYSQADEQKPAVRKRRQATKRDEPVDPVLPEKKRARRRLVGAIALVLAAIIGLPMILDSEPKPLADDVAIQIPSKDTAAPIAPSKPAVTEKAPEQSAPAAQTLSPNEEVIEPATPTVTAPMKE